MFRMNGLFGQMIQSYSLLRFILTVFLVFPTMVHSSFIESTMGTAVVNDATASYHNPAALSLLKSSQIIAIGSIANLNTHFVGQSTQTLSGFTLYGNSDNSTDYYLPSLYLGIPVNSRLTAGFALLSNFFNRELGDHSVLRYAQSNNSLDNVDFVYSLGFKLNQLISLGAGVNYSKAKFNFEPVSGVPNLGIPDSQSKNQSKGDSWGGDVGILLTPSTSTTLGFNYRSVNTYLQNGTSVFEGNPPITANNYSFKYWTPARSVFSINQFITPKLGAIGTVQYIQWSIFKTVTNYNVATQIGATPLIVPIVTVPHYLHDSWILTLGGHYRSTPKCIVRVAGTYIQSPGNGNYQIISGDSIILGGSIGYDLTKNLTVDASYAHAYMDSASIHTISGRTQTHGINKASRDSISLKLTLKAANSSN